MNLKEGISSNRMAIILFIFHFFHIVENKSTFDDKVIHVIMQITPILNSNTCLVLLTIDPSRT
jgi:hypothetical protein